MLKQHCGADMVVHQRDITPIPNEVTRGVQTLRVFVCWCQASDCRRRQVYTQEFFPLGIGIVTRTKKQDEGRLVKRLQQGKESDWVWGYHPETYTKVKRPV